MSALRPTVAELIHYFLPADGLIVAARDAAESRPRHRLGRFYLMSLDVKTLFMVTIYVEAILGLLLLFVWVQNTAIRAVAWWGFAHLIRAASIVLFGTYGAAPDLISIDLANALLFTSFAVTWTGARLFDGRPAEPVYLVTGAVLWLLVCRLPVLAEAIEVRALIATAIITAYTGSRPTNSGAAAARRWCRAGRRSSCCSRRLAVPAAHAAGRRCCRGRSPTACSAACG